MEIPKLKDAWAVFKTEIQEGGKKANQDFKDNAKATISDFKSIERKGASTKTGWQLLGIVLLLPLFFLGLFFLFIAGALLWDIVFGL